MIDFFSNQCKTTTNVFEFWLADSQDNKTEPAYVTTNGNDPAVVASVENLSCISIDFYAIDKCIVIQDINSNDVSLCDVMLLTSTHLIFLELKNKRDNWIEKSINQLESTIAQFKLAHPDCRITKRIAYTANRMRPEFAYSERERMRRFKNNTGFRLIIEAKVII